MSATIEGNEKKERTYYVGLRTLPYGKCIWSELWKHDPLTTFWKFSLVGISASMLFGCLFLPSRFTSNAATKANHIEISEESITLAWSSTISFFSVLCIMDIFIAINSHRAQAESKDHDEVWWWKFYLPTSLIKFVEKINDSDTSILDQCYFSMFGELNRGRSRLIRCVGNTYSNCLYLWISIVLLTMKSTTNNTPKFPLADTIFGVMMFILAISSTFWHATQLLVVQYIDIWSMEAVIAYLLIRFPCMLLIPRNGLLSQDFSCALIYAAYNAQNAKRWIGLYRNKWLHSTCPFAGRTRLIKMKVTTNPSKVASSVSPGFSSQNKSRLTATQDAMNSVGIIDFCTFASIPVIYLTIPAILITLKNGFDLSSMALPPLLLKKAVYSLITGWTYRNCDRWILDWFPFHKRNVVLSSNEKKSSVSLGSIVLSALFSPTAVFHTLTGITLWNAFLLVLYLDQTTS